MVTHIASRQLNDTIRDIQRYRGDEALRNNTPYIPTGSPNLDTALTIGGIPQGRITMLSGFIGSGKRALAAHILAHAQTTRDCSGVYIDPSHSVDLDYLAHCGVDLETLFVARPKHSAQALDIALTLAKCSDVAAIVLDDWTDLASDVAFYLDGGAFLDCLVYCLARSGVALLALSEPEDWQSSLYFWNELTNPGINQYAAVHLACTRERWLSDDADILGYRSEVTIEKNKFGPTGQIITLDIDLNGMIRDASDPQCTFSF